MTKNFNRIVLITASILTSVISIFLPFFLKNQSLLKVVQIIILVFMFAALVYHILFLEKNNENVNYKNAFLVISIAAVVILIGRLIYNFV